MSADRLTLLAPLAGWSTPLGEVPEGVRRAHARRRRRDRSDRGTLHAPCDGEVTVIAAAQPRASRCARRRLRDPDARRHRHRGARRRRVSSMRARRAARARRRAADELRPGPLARTRRACSRRSSSTRTAAIAVDRAASEPRGAPPATSSWKWNWPVHARGGGRGAAGGTELRRDGVTRRPRARPARAAGALAGRGAAQPAMHEVRIAAHGREPMRAAPWR